MASIQKTAPITRPFKFGSLLKSLFVITVGVYLLVMACYVLLRLLFGDRFWWLSLANTFANWLFLPLLLLAPIAMLLGLRRGVLRLLPLTLIGMIWFAPYFLPRSVADESSTSLKVLTFNVWGGNRQIETVGEWVANSAADVVMLQEITPQFAETLLPALHALYPYSSSQVDFERWGGSPNYNVTLSRYPIVDMQEIDLNTPRTANPVRTLLDVNGERVAVYNIHLAWPGGRPRLSIPRRLNNTYIQLLVSYNDQPRNQQIDNLLTHLEAEPFPYIVAGDFNTSDATPTYNQIADHMIDSFREAGTGLGGSWPVSSVRGLPSIIPPIIRIDYIWHSDHFATINAEQGPPLGSDHLALVATLALHAGT